MEISWLRSLFRDLHISLTASIIWCDNISSISFAFNPIFYSIMKHLEIDYHYICDKVVHRELHVRYIHTTDQVADIFTKGLSSARFALLSAKLIHETLPQTEFPSFSLYNTPYFFPSRIILSPWHTVTTPYCTWIWHPSSSSTPMDIRL